MKVLFVQTNVLCIQFLTKFGKLLTLKKFFLQFFFEKISVILRKFLFSV